MKDDIRWVQRFDSFTNDLSDVRTLSDLERQGVIKAFEFTHELAWNLLKDYFTHIGIEGIIGSKDAYRRAFFPLFRS